MVTGGVCRKEAPSGSGAIPAFFSFSGEATGPFLPQIRLLMARPLEVLADVQLAVDGEEIDVRGHGDHIVVDVPSLRAGRRLFTTGPFAAEFRARTTRRLHEALRSAGLSAEVRLRGDPIARIGVGARPGALGRMLSLDGLEIRPTQPLRRALRRRPIVTALVVTGLLVLLGGWLLQTREP